VAVVFSLFGDAEELAFDVTDLFGSDEGVSSASCFRDFLRGGGLIGRTGSNVCIRRTEDGRVAAPGVPVDVDSGVGIALSSGDIVSLGEDAATVSLGNSDRDSPGKGERSGLSLLGVGLAFSWTFLRGVGVGSAKKLLIFSPNDGSSSSLVPRAWL
jgi:hypothetical protein